MEKKEETLNDLALSIQRASDELNELFKIAYDFKLLVTIHPIGGDSAVSWLHNVVRQVDTSKINPLREPYKIKITLHEINQL